MANVSAFNVKERVKSQILKIPGVSGIGVSPARNVPVNLGGEYGPFEAPEMVNIYVTRLTPELEAELPKEIDGVETNIIEIGEVIAFDVDPTMKHRPAFPGISIGNIDITAGTLGAVVIDNETGLKAILSNTHVLTSSPIQNTSSLEIFQPGVHDGGALEENKIATLARWIVLKNGEVDRNFIDCGIAIPENQEDLTEEVLGIGVPVGAQSAEVDMRVVKSGRTTGVTFGNVLDVNATLIVNYLEHGIMLFDDLIVADKMGAPGDSGSLVLNSENNRAIGLLFAGSSTIIIICKMDRIIPALNITIGDSGPVLGEPPVQGLSPVTLGLGVIGLLGINSIQGKKKRHKK